MAGREWYGDLDWDLLLECLDRNRPNPGKALLDDFVTPGRERHRDWRPELERQIQTVWQAGGRVFVADHVLSADTYRDLPQTASPFSEYERTKFAGVDAERLSDQIKAFFDAYGPVESPVKIGTNRFRELKLASPAKGRFGQAGTHLAGALRRTTHNYGPSASVSVRPAI